MPTPSDQSRPVQQTDLEARVRAGEPVEHLQIGECILSRRPVLVTTVLGSCVAVTFHHPPSATGAICHAMLPDGGPQTAARSGPCKFVDRAVAAILERLDALGVPRRELTTTLFGGGFTIQPERKAHVRDVVDVGRKNVEAARRELARHGLTPVLERVLGDRGRKLFFHTGSGEVWVRFVDEPPPRQDSRRP
jgi:chemotaxis protein CheD